jgi:hypothetical protein
MQVHLAFQCPLQNPSGQLLNNPVLSQNFFLSHAAKIDLLQQPIPLIFLFFLSLGHVCSFGISTTD